jgi:ribonucleotide monophosphatase NagD (HAD superfamily)
MMNGRIDYKGSRPYMVGDRLASDVLFGIEDNGLKSVLVLLGVTSEENLLSATNAPLHGRFHECASQGIL